MFTLYLSHFNEFHPDRFASRILGMGDIVSLVEKAQDVIDEKKALKLQEKILSEGLTLADFLERLGQTDSNGGFALSLGCGSHCGNQNKPAIFF